MARLRIFLTALLAVAAMAAPALAQNTAGMALRGASPYEPIGVGVGRFTLFPSIELGGTFTGGTIGTPGAAIHVTPELALILNGSPHDFRVDFDATIIPVATYQAALVAAANARIALSLDLPSLWRLDLDAFFALTEQGALDALLPDSLDEPPHVRTAGAEATLEGPVGPMTVRATVAVERGLFEDGIDSGVPVDQGDRDYTTFRGTLRIAGAGDAIFTPFVEMEAGRRVHDRPVGMDGFLQAGNFTALRAGFFFNSAPVTTAEIAVGYRRETPDDPGLLGLAGPTLGLNATWSPREIVVVAFSALTSFRAEPTLLSGGSIRQDYSLRTTIAARENLTLGGTAEYAIERFDGGITETTLVLGTDFVWNVNRGLAMTAGVSHQWLWSPDPTRNGQTTTVEVTARVAR